MLGLQFRLVWCGLTTLLTDNCISFTKTPHLGVFFMAKIIYDLILDVNIYMENNTQITIADLDTIRNIIDLACTRGAFRGAELSQVGAVFDKLNSFLEAVVAQAQARAQEETNADAGEPQGE
jgi:hypothetical protein